MECDIFMFNTIEKNMRKIPQYDRDSQETGKPECIFTTLSFADGSVAVVESGWSLPESWVTITQPPGWRGSGSMRFDLNGSEGYLSLDFRAPLKPGHGVLLAHRLLRERIAHADQDYEVRNDIETCAGILRRGELATAVEVDIGLLA